MFSDALPPALGSASVTGQHRPGTADPGRHEVCPSPSSLLLIDA
jgi:hypothetical protein